MSDHNTTTTDIDPLFQLLMNLWESYVREADTATMNIGNRADLFAQRRQWFDLLGRKTDAYLRSPLFLQAMKAHIDTLIDVMQRASMTQNETITSGTHLGALERAAHSQLKQFSQQADAVAARAGDACSPVNWDQLLNAVCEFQPASQTRLKPTPCDVVYERGTMKLLHFRGHVTKFAEPILICYALVNRPYILDLRDDRSVVRRLCNAGFDVYLIDWGVPTDADRTLHLYDYVCRLMKDAVDEVCVRAHSPNVNLLGYCMGGTMATMFAALYPEHVRNLILLATPIDFSSDEGLLNIWTREEYFNVDKFIDVCGNCPGAFLRYCFQLTRPVQNFVEKSVTICENLSDSAFLDNFLAIERWANDSIPVAGETFREFVKLLYQQNRLVKGEMSLDGVPVKLNAINCPLLLLVAGQDHLVPPSSALAMERHVRSVDVQTLSIDTGHIGLAVSSRAHRELWPTTAYWIGEHSTLKH